MRVNRRGVRFGAAALAAAMAAIYFLIGVGVLTVVEPRDDGSSMIYFGLPAGSAFLLGALLLLTQDRRRLWIAGLALQVFVVWGYFAVAPSRTPSYEVWGLTLRAIQVPLIAALAYLALRPPIGRMTQDALRG